MNSSTRTDPASRRPAPPAARRPGSGARLRGARRRSVPHLLLGALLVVGCGAGAMLAMSSVDTRRPVLALARPVAIGHLLATEDLRQVDVTVDTGVSVVPAAQAPTVVGRIVGTSLPAGVLLTMDVLDTPTLPAAGQAIVAVAAKDGQFPPEIGPGAPVWVVFAATPRADTGSASPAELSVVWPAVVISVTASTDRQTTVVSLEVSDRAARQLAAAPTGQVSLVLVSTGGH